MKDKENAKFVDLTIIDNEPPAINVVCLIALDDWGDGHILQMDGNDNDLLANGHDCENNYVVIPKQLEVGLYRCTNFRTTNHHRDWESGHIDDYDVECDWELIAPLTTPPANKNAASDVVEEILGKLIHFVDEAMTKDLLDDAEARGFIHWMLNKVTPQPVDHNEVVELMVAAGLDGLDSDTTVRDIIDNALSALKDAGYVISKYKPMTPDEYAAYWDRSPKLPEA